MQMNCTTNRLESPPYATLALGGNLEDWQQKILADSTGIIPYTAKNDYMFKAICQTNTYALKGLLAALLNMKMEEIQEIDILNPIQLGETVHEKDCILDVKLKLNNNRIINIELQVAHQPDWPERSLDYLCNAVTMQVKLGAPYGSFLSTIHIGILDFDLFPDHKEFNSLYYLTEAKTRHIYTGKFALAVVNLKQINRATEEDIASGLRDWAKLFQATTWEEMKMIAKNNESMESFTFSLKQLTNEEKIQMQCEARRRYECDKASLLHHGFNEGREVGIQQGIQQEQGNTLREQDRANAERQRADAILREKEALEEELCRLKAELNK